MLTHFLLFKLHPPTLPYPLFPIAPVHLTPSSRQVLNFIFSILTKPYFLSRLQLKLPNIKSRKLVQWQLRRYFRTDGLTDMTKLKDNFLHYAKVPNQFILRINIQFVSHREHTVLPTEK